MTLFNLSSERFAKQLRKAGFDESKIKRDEKGRFSSTGAAVGVGAAALGAGLVGAAALGVPGARSIVPGVRRAVIAARTRAAQRAAGSTGGRVSSDFKNLFNAKDQGSFDRLFDRLTNTGRGALQGAVGNLGRHSRAKTEAARVQYGISSPARNRRLNRIKYGV